MWTGRWLLVLPRLSSWRKDAASFTYDEMLVSLMTGNMALTLTAGVLYFLSELFYNDWESTIDTSGYFHFFIV